jgi:tetraacyldisaccharide 4'-kinase
VISVGGLTVGGSGKTPLASELARRVSRGGWTAVVTHGFDDEMRVHRELAPGVAVVGGSDRLGAVEAAAAAGAELAVVDGGFQHRRLWRDADVVAVPAGATPSRARLLPAGPYREGWRALARADAVVVVRRGAPVDRARSLAAWLARAFPDAAVARCRLRPAGLGAANRAAAARPRADPAVAVASIMYPEVFLARLGETGVRPEAEWVLSDHAEPGAETVRDMAGEAGERGVVGTLKDVVKLRGALPDDVPLWCAREELVWEAGSDDLAARLADLTELVSGPGTDAECGDSRKGTRT